MSNRITDAQRQRILRHFKKLEWSTATVSRMHLLADFGAAQFEGMPVDQYLDSMTVESASALITRLERMC